jgi:hypothetical protein
MLGMLTLMEEIRDGKIGGDKLDPRVRSTDVKTRVEASGIRDVWNYVLWKLLYLSQIIPQR